MANSVNGISDRIKKISLTYLLFIVTSIVFLSLTSITTSPLFDYPRMDSLIFLLLGRYFKEGMTPYVDFFDHKGPVMFFIEAIGVSLSSNERLGIFILQVVNLTITQVLIFCCGRLFLDTWRSVIVVVFSLFILSFTMQGGNLTEEYSLPFLMISLYFALKYCVSKSKDVYFGHMFTIGISAAILFWLRPTNAGVICACALFFFIWLMKIRNWKGLRTLIVGVSTGFVLVSLVIVLYFIWIEAFDEMIYSSFTYNFKYASKAVFLNEDKTSLVYYFRTWFSLLVLLAGTLLFFIKRKDEKLTLLALLIFVFNLITTKIIGPGYFHYMTLNIPCLALGVIFIFDATTNYSYRNKFATVLCLVSVIVFLVYFGRNLYKSQQYDLDSDYKACLKGVMSHIPKDEFRSTFGYNVQTHFWFYSHLKPYFKYFTLQDWQQSYDEKIEKETNDMIINNPPLWLIIEPAKPEDGLFNMQIFDVIRQKYDLRDENAIFELYRLKE